MSGEEIKETLGMAQDIKRKAYMGWKVDHAGGV